MKEYIIPGYSFFRLVLPKENNNQISNFLKAYDDFKQFMSFKVNEENYYNRYNNLPEDYIYEKEDYDNIKINKEKYDKVIPLFTDNDMLLSTGEKNILKLISELTYEFKKFSRYQPACTWQDRKTFIILIDEIESSMHLEWSRKFINFLTAYLEEQTFSAFDKYYHFNEADYKVQLIFTTHSPFMLSDIVNNSTILLKTSTDNKHIVQKSFTSFAQNIQEIMRNSLFVEDYFGEFSKTILNSIIDKINSDTELGNDDIKEMNYIINQIGEPILKNKLLDMFSRRFDTNTRISEEDLLVKNIRALYGEFNEEAIKNIKDLFVKKQE